MIETLLNIGCWIMAWIAALAGLTRIASGFIGIKLAEPEHKYRTVGIAFNWLMGGLLLYAAWKFVTL